MRDICTETLVPIIPSAKDRVLKILIIAQVIVSVFLVILLGILGIAVLCLSLWLLSRQLRKTDAEYEYVHTNEVFDVDMVINNSKRKQLCSVNLNTVALVAPAESADMAVYSHVPQTDYSGNCQDSLYAMVYTKDGKRQKLLLKLDASMYKSLKLWLPGKVK